MFKQNDQISSLLLEAISEAVLVVDNHQKIVEINAAAEDIFGYSKKELVGKNLDILLPSNYHKSHATHFNEFIKKGTRRKMSDSKDIFGLHKNGDILELDLELVPFTVFDKPYVMALIKDISHQLEIEKNLMIKSRALESANNGIIITDALKHDNPVIYVNTAFQNITGYKSEEVLNRNCRFLYGTDKDQESLKTLKSAIEKGESCRVILRNNKKDGTLFWNELYIMPITNSEGLVTNFIGIQEDITDKKREEEERRHLSTIFDDSLNEIHVFDAKTLNLGAFEIGERMVSIPNGLQSYSTIVDFKKACWTILKVSTNTVCKIF